MEQLDLLAEALGDRLGSGREAGPAAEEPPLA
jgi:hypothetical protein